jgi:hypothetical protein
MKAALINIWFSENFPNYFDFFCKSCEINKNNFDYYIFTNLVSSKQRIKNNIFLIPYSWAEMINDFGIKKSPNLNLLRIWPKGGCPYRMLLFKKEMWKDYDFIGTFDIDVIFGNLIDFVPFNSKEFGMITPHSGRMTPSLKARNCAPFCLYNKENIDIIWEYEEKREDALDDNYLFYEFFTKKYKVSTPENLQPIGDTLPMGYSKKGKKMIDFKCVWKNGEIFVEGIRGGFFHLLPFKNYINFKIDKKCIDHTRWNISKYGIRNIILH